MKLWVFLIALGMVACNRPNSQNIQKAQANNEKEQAANAVLHKVACQMKEELKLRPCGTMGQMMNKVQKLGLSFSYFQPVDIVEGRKLLVKAAEAMMHEMNQEERIRPYLGCHPVRPWNVEIEIFLHNPNSPPAPSGSLGIIDVSDGILHYKMDRPDNSYQLVTVYQETYQEALDRLADPSLPLASFEPRPEWSAEELAQLRKNIRCVSQDGSIYHLGENGEWVRDVK